VKARTSSERYDNPDKDLTVIAKELKVAFILEGSVRKSGDDLRITAQLIEGKTGDHIWAETYDGKYTSEIFTFQSDVAKKVASSLQAVITPKEEEQIDYRPTENMEAYDLSIRGQEMLRKFRYTLDTAFARIAINLFNQSQELDPGNEIINGSKAQIYTAMGSYDTAMYYADRMIELFPEFSGGYQNKGNIFMLTNQLDSAYKYLNIGYSKSPNDPWTNLVLGQYYENKENNSVKALPYYQRAYELGGEEWAEINGNIGQLFLNIGEYTKAEKYFKHALKLRQECLYIFQISWTYMIEENYEKMTHFLDSICSITTCEQNCNEIRCNYHMMRKEYEEAEKYYEQYLSTGGGSPVGMFLLNLWAAYIYKETGREQKAYKTLSSLENIIEQRLSPNTKWFFLILSSMSFAIQNDHKESLRYLNEAVNIGLKGGFHDFFPICPIYEDLWDDPEFKAIIKRAQDEKAAIRAQLKEMEEHGEIDL